MRDYEDLGCLLEIRPRSESGRTFLFDAEWMDVTPHLANATTWLVRQKAGAGPDCSFRVTVACQTAPAFEHPMPVSKALKLGMLMAIRDELAHVGSAIQTGDVIVQDHPVTVTKNHLAEGVRKAYGVRRSKRTSRVAPSPH